MGELNFCRRGRIFDALFDAGVAFLVPQTVWGGFIGEGVAFSTPFMSKGLRF